MITLTIDRPSHKLQTTSSKGHKMSNIDSWRSDNISFMLLSKNSRNNLIFKDCLFHLMQSNIHTYTLKALNLFPPFTRPCRKGQM